MRPFTVVRYDDAMSLALEKVVSDFAEALAAADARRPAYTSRTGRQYQPGIGPHAEDRAVALALQELRRTDALTYKDAGQGLAYPGSRQKCDLWIGDPLEWVIEIKMARFFGDNGKPDDTALKDVLSPYEVHRSALTDAVKLTSSALAGRKAILIYGFENPTEPGMPLEPAIAAFEVLARQRVTLGIRHTAPLGSLVHPVHARGFVYGWQVGD